MLENWLSIVEGMSSEYTKILLIIFVLLVLSAGLWLLQSSATKMTEYFIDDSDIELQRKFVDSKINSARIGDASIDITRLPNPETLKQVTEDIDLFSKKQRPQTENWYTDTINSPVLKAEMKCRATQKPQDLPDDSMKQHTDCTWMYNPVGKSGATLCNLKGPVLLISQQLFPNSQYQMLWSKTEAIKKEAIKQCALTTKCELLIPGSGCGFCPDKGYAIPIDGAGQPLYPEARCTSPPVLKSDDCAKPVSQGGGGQASLTCEPDSEGRLSKTCLSAIATQASMTTNGTVQQALLDSSQSSIASPQVQQLASIMQSYNYSIPPALLSDGKTTVDTALQTYMRISAASTSASSPRVQKAAANLSAGAPFDFCDYDNSSTEAFDLSCIQKLYQNAGCQGRGLEFPTEDNKSQFAGKTWGSIKQNVYNLVDKMTNQTNKYTSEQQKEAIQRCIGTHLRESVVSYCNELGISVLMFIRSGSNNKYAYYGRKILTNQFLMLRSDSTLWNSLEIFNSQLTQGNDVLLVVKTNFNPDSPATVGYMRVGNTPDVIKWNDAPLVNKPGMGISQDPVNGLVLATNQQENQRLEVDLLIPASQVNDRSTTWYMVDNNNKAPSITMCRLPIERKNPVMNITMNQGSVTETTGTFDITESNTVQGNKGGRSCTVFNGNNSFVKINTLLRNKAFRSYTMKFYCETVGQWTRLWQLYNGGYNWGWQWGGWGWYYGYSYNTEDYGSATDALDIELGYFSLDLAPQYKTPGAQLYRNTTALKLNTWQHVTLVWNDNFSAYTMYLDGKQVATASGNPIAEAWTRENFIGKGYYGQSSMFQGGVEWFRAFDYPLGPDEIKQDMADDWQKKR